MRTSRHTPEGRLQRCRIGNEVNTVHVQGQCQTFNDPTDTTRKSTTSTPFYRRRAPSVPTLTSCKIVTCRHCSLSWSASIGERANTVEKERIEGPPDEVNGRCRHHAVHCQQVRPVRVGYLAFSSRLFSLSPSFYLAFSSVSASSIVEKQRGKKRKTRKEACGQPAHSNAPLSPQRTRPEQMMLHVAAKYYPNINEIQFSPPYIRAVALATLLALKLTIRSSASGKSLRHWDPRGRCLLLLLAK